MRFVATIFLVPPRGIQSFYYNCTTTVIKLTETATGQNSFLNRLLVSTNRRVYHRYRGLAAGRSTDRSIWIGERDTSRE